MAEEKNSQDGKSLDSEMNEREKIEDKEPDVSFGLGPWKTTSVRESHQLYLFAVLTGLLGMFSSMVPLTLAPQIESFDKHFHFEPMTTAPLVMSMEVMGKAMIIFSTGFIANYMPIPRMTALTGIVCGIGMTLPLYLNVAEPYTYPQPPTTTSPPPTTTGGSSMTTSPPGFATAFTCNLSPNTTLPPQPVYDGSKIIQMLIGNPMLLSGMLSAVRWGPMAFVFFDNNVVDKTKLGIYLAISICVAEMSKPFGYFFNLYVKEISVDLEDPKMSPESPAFVAAWWLGPTVFGFLTTAVSIPILFLPSDLMSGSQQYDQVKRANAKAVHPDMKPDARTDEDDIAHMTKGVGLSAFQKMKAYGKGFPRIFKNPLFSTLYMLGGIFVLPALGLSVLNLPYIIFEYNVDAQKATEAFTFTTFAANTMAAIVSACVCCNITRKRHYLKFIMYCVFLSSALIPISFFFGCEDVRIYGANGPQYGANMTGKAVACPCDYAPGIPICGADGNNYRSPCHAGCTMATMDGSFVDCKNLDSGDTAVPQLCPGDGCNDQFFNYNILYTITTFFTRMTEIPMILLALRIIAPRDRSLALAALMLSGIVSMFLGPLLMGTLFNDNCLVRLTEQICTYYDRRGIRMLKTGVEFHTYLFAFVMWYALSKLNRLTDKKLMNEASSDSGDKDENVPTTIL